MRILFFDDSMRRHKEFKRNSIGHVVDHAESPAQAIRLLEEHEYDMVFLDYDMTEDPFERAMDDYESGMVVVDYIATNPMGRHECLFVIHSLNDEGAMEMLATLRAVGLKVIRREWAWQVNPVALGLEK